ncbi:MAG: cobalamin-dependent protein [Deltaproteobacteria bacterium]|nr:cobalamin-dependent protein [Deltaproteobacteria bacterium]
MKILMFRPSPPKETIGLQHVMVVEPLELEVLGATVEKDDEVQIIDFILEKRSPEYFIRKFAPDMLCVTGYITNVLQMKEYCTIAKSINPSIVTVAGGVHLEVNPADLDDISIDFRVVRNAVTAFPALIRHIKYNESLPPGVFRPREAVENLPEFDFSFPHPDRTLVSRYRKHYFYIFHDKVALLKTAFGCPYSCNFCFCRIITSDNFAQRPIEDVLDELETIEEKEIYIVDDDFLVSPSRLEQFMDGLLARNIKKSFLIYGRSDFIVAHVELISRFKELGLRTVIVGFESFDPDELEKYNKMTDPLTNEKAMQILNSLGIDCYATVILPPEWGHKDFDRLVEKLIELDVKYVNLQPLTPIPGTGYQVDKNKLLIHPGDYPKWDLAHVAITPEKMSVAEYYQCIIKAYERILFRPSVIKNHLRYSPKMLYKMLKGSWAVHKQYKKKYKEALKNA